MANAKSVIRIGGASGYWGESTMATPQLLSEELDFLVYDYLAEITMSIMARARLKDADKGYAPDFVSATLKPNLKKIAKQGVRVLSNAGGVNPKACGRAVQKLVSEMGLDLKVAVVTGDDLLSRLEHMDTSDVSELFKGSPFPAKDKVVSMNAYIGAEAIVAALDAGADIVITGRCADSALTLAACVHTFGWQFDDFDRLAAGSLAGHILECGPQATGGNYTDWRDVADSIADIGYPIADIASDGTFDVRKPTGTGGQVSVGTVSEQLVYEIEDPSAYLLPDVVCDFTEVTVSQKDDDFVRVAGAKGRAPTPYYKVSVTYADGFKGGAMLTFCGYDVKDKARAFADAVFKRAEKMLRLSNAGDYDEKSVELLGAESQFGCGEPDTKEVVLKLAARHERMEAIGLLLKEISGMGLATPAGLTIFNAGRPKPSPIVKLFSYLESKDKIPLFVSVDGSDISMGTKSMAVSDEVGSITHAVPDMPSDATATYVPLIKLAWARSGDKGDRSNIGIIARDPKYVPYIASALGTETVAKYFGHFSPSKVERFYMPGSNTLNFVLHDVLGGGGVASLRADSQGKAYGQILLHAKIPVSAEIAQELK